MNLTILSPFEFRKIFKNQIKLINETSGPHSYGCIMGYIDSQLETPSIENSELYQPFTHGIEEEKHITLLYGIEDEQVDLDDILDFLKCLKLPTIELTGISLFENEDFDVIKFEVNSDLLHTMNKLACMSFPFKTDHPEYVPHVTIGYVLPGNGSKYKEIFDTPRMVDIDYWIYSRPNGEKWKVDKDGNVEQIKHSEEELEKLKINYRSSI